MHAYIRSHFGSSGHSYLPFGSPHLHCVVFTCVRSCLLLCSLGLDWLAVMPGLHSPTALVLRKLRAIDRGYIRRKHCPSTALAIEKSTPVLRGDRALTSSTCRGRWADIEDVGKDVELAEPFTTLCGATDSQEKNIDDLVFECDPCAKSGFRASGIHVSSHGMDPWKSYLPPVGAPSSLQKNACSFVSPQATHHMKLRAMRCPLWR